MIQGKPLVYCLYPCNEWALVLFSVTFVSTIIDTVSFAICQTVLYSPLDDLITADELDGEGELMTK